VFEPPHCIEKKKKQNSTQRGGIHLLVTSKNRNSTRRGGINLLVALKKMGRVAPSPSCILSEGGGWGCDWTGPSVLHFERGRGLEVVGRKMVPPPSRALSEGGGWRWLGRRRPSVSLFEGIGWLELGRPLHLTFRAREGVGGGWKENGPPPSHALSEGGGWRWLGRRWASVSLFEGIGVVGTWKTPPSRVSSEGGERVG